MKFGTPDLTDLSIFEELNTPNPNKSRHLKILREILDTNLYLETTDGRDRTPLMFAIVKKDIAAVKLILRYHPNLNKIATIPGKASTPLMEAVKNQSFTITKLLVDAGADVYLRVPPDNKNVIDTLDDLLGLTWIHHDMRNKLTRIKNYLLKANHSARIIQGNFRKYITKKKVDSANLIKKNYLHYAYKPGGPGYNRAKKHFESVMKFGSRSIFEEINKKVNSKGEPSTKRINIVTKMLLKNISLLYTLDENGMTPLMKAVREDDKEMAEFLIYKFEPDLNVFANIEGITMTPLILAAVTANLFMVKTLVNAGADMSIRNDRNKNVFDIVKRQIRIFRDWKQMREAYEKINDYLLKAKHSANVIKQHYKVYDTKRKTNAATVIQRNYLNHSYKPGGPGYNRTKKHFESAFGRKKRTSVLHSDLKKVLK